MNITPSSVPLSSEDAVAEQAAEWIVRLTADDEGEREQARVGFEAWKQADPRHDQTATHLEGFIQQLQNLQQNSGNSTRPVQAALDAAFSVNRKQRRAKHVGKLLVVILALALPVWSVLRFYPLPYLMADLWTGTDEWKTQTLADGSRITLGSTSAINLHFNAHQRTVELVRGEVLVKVAHDPARAFVVETQDGSIRALGTQFIVRRDKGSTELTMLQSKVFVQTNAQRTAKMTNGLIVDAGHRVRITPTSTGQIEDIDARETANAWQFHQLVVQSRPLPEVLDELGRYRHGFIGYERAPLQNIKVSAVLPLDHTDQALQLLATSLPSIRIRTMTPYLVFVDRADSQPAQAAH